MCGIAGIVSPSIHADEKRYIGGKMLNQLKHRGPDGDGVWGSSEGEAWLGHRRLAIIDPEGGKQPLSNEDGSIWLTFNGCIYNYLELSQTLRQKGHKFKTYSDTEVIVHAYEEYGIDCVKYFIGMFAFTIWDSNKKILFSARDRMGIKPFYYYFKNETFIFGSEIKALLGSGLMKPEVNTSSMSNYLIFQTVLGEKTLFQGINKLLPGHTLVFDAKSNRLDINKYWDLNYEIDFEHDEAYFVSHLQRLLDDAVKIRLRSDVSLGAHLSGGLDSSSVVSLASIFNTSGASIKTFTGAFAEGEHYDETKYARLVAEKTKSEYLEIFPTADDFIDELSNIMFYMDEPSAGPGVFPQYMLSKLASQHVKVALGGQGGDEIFAGYTRYLIGYLEECLKGAIDGTNQKQEYAATLASITPNLTMLKQYVPMLKYFWSDGLFEEQDSRYFRLMNRSGDSQHIYQRDLLGNNSNVFSEFQSIFNGSNAKSFLNKMLYFDLKVHLPALLHVEDRTSMAWGLESRVPLLDHRIVEFMATVPPNIKFKGGEPKYLFKQAIQDLLPKEVLNRTDKMGFPVPLQSWYKTHLKSYVKEILLDKSAKERGIFNIPQLEQAIQNENSFGRATWGALCIELWFKNFIDNPIS